MSEDIILQDNPDDNNIGSPAKSASTDKMNKMEFTMRDAQGINIVDWKRDSNVTSE